jgi:aminoglycoside phosphotransferase (APT) family kinase protein
MKLPPAARAWLESVGVREPVRVRRLASARTADLFVVNDLVLRWYEGGRFLEAEPDAIEREVVALTALVDSSVPAPRLVASSHRPAAVLMTLLPGKARLRLPDPAIVAAVLNEIHSLDPEPLSAWTFRGYHDGLELVRPVWWHDARLWEGMVWRTRHDRPSAPLVPIHRDFHPDNMLWTGAELTGIVDWGNACLGPAAFDVSHYRVNLAQLHGPEATDAHMPGDPAWDLEAVLSFLDWWDGPARVDAWSGYWPQISTETARARLELFARRAMDKLRA